VTRRPTVRPPSSKRLPWLRRRWVRVTLLAVGVTALAGAVVFGYYFTVFSKVIDKRLHGERERVLPRVYARPLEVRRRQALTLREFVDRLNALGYADRPGASKPGEFVTRANEALLRPKGGSAPEQLVRVVFAPAPKKTPAAPATIERIDVDGQPRESVTLEAPVLTSLISTGRQKRRQVPLATIPDVTVKAVLAIEDRRFFGHPGVDPIRMVGALRQNLRGDRPYLEGASTITQQLVKNVFLPEVIANPTAKSYRRKLLEQFMAIVLERRASKNEILELYLNDVYLGQRGSFAVHGVAEAARLFFGKDVSNLTLAESATIAGVIHSPPALSPFSSPARSRDRRNVVLREMEDAGYVTAEAARAAAAEPLTVVARALESEAPYFVDYVGEVLAEQFPGLTGAATRLDVYTTLDLHLQRLAQDAVRQGLEHIDELLKRRKRPQPAQAALVAVDPRTGEVLALVGGRSYNQTQFNRATTARRQPGSAFKPFVYLAAFERQLNEGLTTLTPASLVVDEPTTFIFEDKTYAPGNYEDDYEGMVTLRRALARSLNNATVKVAEVAGYWMIADLWRRIGAGIVPQPYPSIALGVFEATPLEVATAYTIFPNLGAVRRLHPILHVVRGGADEVTPPPVEPRRVAHAETTYLVLNMMRSVLSEGTGGEVRASGFLVDAAGKTGTTNDLRDAWFVGFTPELLTVVWTGFDDNQPIGLSGAQAALPIWLSFMKRALAGHADAAFAMPGGLVFAEIDRDTGQLAVPGCPRVFREAFLPGSEPTEHCDLHRFGDR